MRERQATDERCACRQVMEIKPAWLLEVAPHYFK